MLIISSELMQVRRVYPLNRAIPIAILLPIEHFGPEQRYICRLQVHRCDLPGRGREADRGDMVLVVMLGDGPIVQEQSRTVSQNPKRSMQLLG